MTIVLQRPLVLVGAGKMGGALLSGWLAQGLAPRQVFVRDPAPSPEIARLIAERGIPLNFSIADIAARKPAVVVLAVKPQSMAAVLPELGALVSPDTLFISIAAGTSLLRLEELLGGGLHAVRAMPNTPASVSRGITVACANARVTAEQREQAASLLGAVGEVGWVESEPLIDAVTAISGSGPAYVFHLAECLAAAGEALGLDPELSARLARATVSGAGEMLHRLDETPATLRKNVTSPGGTTAAALDVLMGEGGLSQLLRRATAAARDRSRELGQ
ncbi:MAG TPA: pyrroline-5-carboxylate reductase [Parvibaculum sp.]|uniref:pyrroline-5-carboxylate reductase n=1 Tax=Parvibaculum sp. TaxID=2024848 RepID=UPI002BACAF31|nr:pyrroline-5-carboxylate reductase [Parvibaculum sp.]HMM14549.1 pyrroline-5-carboxylate reductase [Parvibaculum sp.]